MNILLLTSSAALVAAVLLRLGGERLHTVCAGAVSLAAIGAVVLAAWGAWQGVALLLAGLAVLGTTRLPRQQPTRGPHRVVRTLMLGAALPGATAAAGLAVMFPLFSLPPPTGPHEVGIRYFVPVDSTRPERLTPEPTDRRVVPLRVWYPADAVPDVGVAPYWPDPAARAATLAGELGLPGLFFSHLDLIATHAHPGAPLLRSAAGHPVLLFSHGYAGAPDQSTFLMEDLASHGYVVVSVGHPYEALPLEVPSGTTNLISQTPEPTPELVDTSLRLLEELRASNSAGRARHAELLPAIAGLPALEESFAVWVADGQFALDWIVEAAAPDGALAGQIDATYIGVFGHSFGGAMAAEVCRSDSRCGAGINIDGAQLGVVAEQGLSAPFLFLYSEPSLWINHAVAEMSPAATQATIAGSAHLDFTDLPPMTPILRLVSMVSPIPQTGSIDRDELVWRTREVIRRFFDAHLRGYEAPEAPYTNVPGVIFERGSGR